MVGGVGIALVQSILGITPYAAQQTLFVDPHLPAWLPEITIRDLHVGQATVALRFFRGEDGRGDYELLDQQGALYVKRRFISFSMLENSPEHYAEWLRS